MGKEYLAMQAIKLYADTHCIQQIDAEHFNYLCENGYMFLKIVMDSINCTVPQLRKCINTTGCIHVDNLTTWLGLECLKIAIDMKEFSNE